jgi:putative ABC transport system substrate-binding protein
MASVGDPVGSGFVASLARPGGDITGVSAITSDLSAKLLGLFVQIIPSMRAIGLVTNSYNPNVAVQLRASQDAIRECVDRILKGAKPPTYRSSSQLSLIS